MLMVRCLRITENNVGTFSRQNAWETGHAFSGDMSAKHLQASEGHVKMSEGHVQVSETHLGIVSTNMSERQVEMSERHLKMSGRHFVFFVCFGDFHHLFLVEKSASTTYFQWKKVLPPFLKNHKTCKMSERHVKMSGRHVKVSENLLQAKCLRERLKCLRDILRCLRDMFTCLKDRWHFQATCLRDMCKGLENKVPQRHVSAFSNKMC